MTLSARRVDELSLPRNNHGEPKRQAVLYSSAVWAVQADAVLLLLRPSEPCVELPRTERTLLMLPVTAVPAKRVRLLGCDPVARGRPSNRAVILGCDRLRCGTQ